MKDVPLSQVLWEAQERLRIAVHGGDIGLWDWDLNTNEVHYSPRWKQQIGYREEEIANTLDEWESRLHPEDIGQVRQALHRRHADPAAGFDIKFRLRHKDGSYRHFRSEASLVKGAQGKPVRMLGVQVVISVPGQPSVSAAESEVRFRTLVEQSIVGIYMIHDGKFIYVNPRMAEITGYTVAEMSAKPVLDLIAPEDRQLCQENMRKRLAGEVTSVRYPLRFLRKGGERVHVEAHGTRINYNGSPAILGSLIDVTEQYQTEEALRAAHQKLQQLLAHSPAVIYSLRLDGAALTTVVSENITRLLGFSTQEILQPGWWLEHIHPEDRDHALSGLADIQKQGHLSREYRIRHKDGRYLWVEDSQQLVRDAAGEPKEIVGVWTDITKRKEAEIALRESEAQFRASFELASVGKVQADPANGRILRANSKFCEIIGYDEAELLRMSFFDFTHPDEIQQDEEALGRLRRGEQAEFHREKRYIRRDGGIIWVQVSAVMITDSQGRPARTSAIIQDITERKRAELCTAAFSSLGQRLNAAKSARRAAEIIMEVADQLIGWDACTLDLYFAEKDQIYHLLNRDLIDGRKVDCPPAYANQVPTARIRRIIKGEGELILKDKADEVLPGAVPFGDTARPSASIMMVPVRDGLKGIGILAIHSYKLQAYTENDLKTLQSLADHCGGALNRIQAEESLAQERNLLRTLIDNLPRYIFVKDTQGRYLLSNLAHTKLVGAASEADLLGKTIFDFAPLETARFYDADDKKIIQSGQPVIGREEPFETNGQQGWHSTTKVPILDGQGNVTGLIGIKYDVTERKQAEVVLRSMNERYSRQEEALTRLTHIYLLHRNDLEEILKEITEITAKALEVERASVWRYGRNQQSIICQSLYERSQQRHSGGTELSKEHFPAYFGALMDSDVIAAHDAHHDPRTAEFSEAYLRPLGINSMLDTPLHSQGKQVGVLCCEHVGSQRHWTADEQTFSVAVANLVSLLLAQADRQKLEEQLRQSQKMEAIGQLAGGVAHDFNNILGAIIGYTELAKMDAGDNPTVRESLDAVTQASRRATDLVRQILAFSCRHEQKRQPTQLQHVVREVLKLLRATVPTTIEFQSKLPKTRVTLADPSEVHQAVMNLGTNAWHAMQDRPGVLSVELADFEVSEDFARSNPDLRPGNYVRLSVRDTGCGMEQATVNRIFEPFFTTKAPGEGTGLGLSVVHGIMKNHDGGITIHSRLGEGTTFHLYFPAYEAEAAEVSSQAPPLPVGQGQHILFVDDEEPLAFVARKVLEKQGYRVTVKNSALAALATFREQPGNFDLVITDYTMPRMNGASFAHELLLLRRDTPIILTTGYSGTMTEEKARELGFRELLLKPNTARALGEAVQRVLEQGKG